MFLPANSSGTDAAVPLEVHGAAVRAGASSWADRSLINEPGFYPKKTMRAAERLAWYSRQLPVAEITATYRFPPTPEQCQLWADRTPEGFKFDVLAWSLLTGNPSFPDSLWPDLLPGVRPSNRERRRLYSSHLTDEALAECWARFAHSLLPLQRAGRLGAVILRYPRWWHPRPETRDALAAASARLQGFPLAVEFRSPRWWEAAECEATLELLEALGVGLVCVDGPWVATGEPPVVAATSDLAVVRFLGRRDVEGEGWTWPHRYSDEELRQWTGHIADLASSTSDVHVLMGNCWKTDAVDGARSITRLLAEDEGYFSTL